jgi:hypothetical protein
MKIVSAYSGCCILRIFLLLMRFSKRKLVCIRGQSLLEALIVVVFVTVIMFAFMQICIITVDDMIANEAAFVAARSAAVTENSLRIREVQKRVRNYLAFFYPTLLFGYGGSNFSHFGFSDKATVARYSRISDDSQENSSGSTVADGNFSNGENGYATIWGGQKAMIDYSGESVVKETVKIYYFTRVLFGRLVSSSNSFKNKRFQSARSRMFPSPDENYYHRAFPGAQKFEN